MGCCSAFFTAAWANRVSAARNAHDVCKERRDITTGTNNIVNSGRRSLMQFRYYSIYTFWSAFYPLISWHTQV